MTDVVDVTLFYSVKLDRAAEQAQLDLWDPQAGVSIFVMNHPKFKCTIMNWMELFSCIDDTRILNAISR